MKRRSTKVSSEASRKGRRTRKQMKQARSSSAYDIIARVQKLEGFAMKPGQTREDWAREHNIDLEWSDKWGRAPKDYRRALPNPWLK